jgi:FtsP/CotA-like multicopper oxidase with cupredoxin domain
MRTESFRTETAGAPEVVARELVELSEGDEFELRIAPVTKQIGDPVVRMLAYNGSIPGPTLKVQEGSEILVKAVNEGDLEATVHWHGLRLENIYDGTHQTQAPIPVGGSFTYRLRFPDPGLYWYHPHIRQDYGQEMGLYGNILVVPAEADYWPPAHREVILTLDDILLEDGKVAPFSHHETNYVAMGRFGTTLLVAGESDLALDAKLGEVVRFYLTDTANTRVFNVGVNGAKMKLIGGDSGRVEREEFVENVILAPSERVVVDVLFDKPGSVTLEHRTPERVYSLAEITVSEERAEAGVAEEFETVRVNDDLSAERERIASYVEAEPDKTLAFVAEMDMGEHEIEAGTGVYACPMHPEIVATWEGKCPVCGMKLVVEPTGTARPAAFACPMHPEITATWAGTCPKCGMTLRPTDVDGGEMAEHEGHEHHGAGHAHDVAGGIEWEDDMVEMNRMTTAANMRWLIVDRETGAENHAIDWQFRVGDQVKIRLINAMESDHPMHHPFHVHGAGRFLILSRDGAVEPNLVWKDTVLVRTGETVDILLDVSNPGLWMAHCHIAEHHESGMMFSFNVAPGGSNSSSQPFAT